ncbi:hypothetical protein LTR10_013813 [Elasticomyces elasticus]|uniref:Mandelate racemase/muconate lactonizing enzyme C-terminal domain-containing protein n=1 Tax=Exophiala sideris TaxID=1016849 RepID=A0ABR0JGA6_9EURO|nr:hypothetical protein LTR10_013813 [Elasticomyces elasticus]KAK5033211.1 hypothetical protein LTS07_003512 [Exophiala sideris]KAK5042291.1 hypothetical protein LTR13_002097 [Exophiala sideris]KAK5063755.1 hypothetical protein LTR69_003520 [Exophiala sideris]
MITDRASFTAKDTVRYLWTTLGLPPDALDCLHLEGEGLGLPSSYKVGHLAHASIGLSGLTAALLYTHGKEGEVPVVKVSLQHAVIEFESERFYLLNGQKAAPSWGPIAGLHATSDGYVRVHANFRNHHEGTLKLLGCQPTAGRAEVGEAISAWRAVDLETAAADNKLVIAALRTYRQWDVTPQAQAISDFPITVTKIFESSPGLPEHVQMARDKCLRGLRVLEMTRVIAGPVAGKTLAAHGADVLWITSPNLPDLPGLDRDLARGKRTAQLDLDKRGDVGRLMDLLEGADVFLQSYRPGSLVAKGLTEQDILARRKGRPLVLANLTAYGTIGPWKSRRGFDSLVQTCSGMNVSEAEHYGQGEPAKVLPCQALDHASGYFLATGIMAALYKQATDGGSYRVDVSLAGTMKYLRSLGQYPGTTGFKVDDYEQHEDIPAEYFETRDSGFGRLTALRHSVAIEGVDVGWEVMPEPLGSHKPCWQ